MWYVLIFVDLLCNIEALYAKRCLYWSFLVFTQPNSTVSKNKTMTMMIVAPSMEGHLEAQLDSVARDGLQLVEGAAGYSETTAWDHRHLKLFLPNIQVYVIIWIVSYNVLYVWHNQCFLGAAESQIIVLKKCSPWVRRLPKMVQIMNMYV